jgi:dephospho-CoA kinase
MTRIIGITGGIGSGKSTLSACFREHGIPTLDADAISRSALLPGSSCFDAAVSLFGPESIGEDGMPDRAYIAKRVFDDPQLLKELNAIIHPYVMRTMLEQAENSDSDLIVWDVPLLFESGADAFCACTVAVLCREEIRVARVMQRDGLTEEQVRSRISRQMTDAQRAALASYAIRNEDTEEAFRAEANELIEHIREELL